MKILFAVLFFSVTFAACSKIEHFTNISQQKIETESLENEQPDAPPILEISQDAQGMWNVIGKTLFFNLYDNGIIEFEFADDKKKTAGKISRAEEINTLKRAKLSAEELKAFTDLLKTEDFLNAKNDYKRTSYCTDATLNFKIDFQNAIAQKNINLTYCDWGEIKGSSSRHTPEVPKMLTDLLILADAAREKYISQ